MRGQAVYNPIADERLLDLAKSRAAEADTLWQGKAVWQVRPASDFPDWAPISPTGFLIYDTLTARMSPRRAGAALVAAIQAKGGEVVTDGPLGRDRGLGDRLAGHGKTVRGIGQTRWQRCQRTKRASGL